MNIKEIEDFLELPGARRMCFSDKSRGLPFNPYSDGGRFWFNISFKDSILPVLESFPEIPHIEMKENRYGRWFAILDSHEKCEIEKLLISLRSVVYLKDLLDCSIAIGMNMEKPEVRTALGEAEYQLKYCESQKAGEKLMEILNGLVGFIPLYRNASCVCCVPSRSKIMIPFAESLASNFGMTDVSRFVNWTNEVDNDVKNSNDIKEKLYLCEKRGISITCQQDIKDKDVLLLDDMYQSGITMQYTALALKEAGARSVLGICLVKALSNS